MMTSSKPFERALEIVLRHEGGLVNDPADPGGITKFGISIRFAGSIGLDLDGDGKTTGADIIALTHYRAAQIYRRYFWNMCQCDYLPGGLALAVFDSAVNQGPGAAAKMLQRAIGGVIVDSAIGPITTKAARSRLDQIALLRDFMARRCKRYAETPNLGRYGRGWFTRVLTVHEAALKDTPL